MSEPIECSVVTAEVQQGAGPAQMLAPAPRRDPEKRRLQNRQAQKAYRERQKQKMRDLEEKPAQQPPAATTEPSLDLSSGSGLDFSFLDVEGDFLYNNPEVSPGNAGFPTGNLSLVPFSPLLFSPLQPQASTSRHPNLWDISSSFQPTAEQKIDDADNDAIEVERTRAPVRQPRVAIIYCSCTEPHEPEWVCANFCAVPNPASFLAQTAVLLPDLAANTIRVNQLCVVQALRADCLTVGVTQRMYDDDSSESPFYRAHSDKETGDAVVKAVQTAFRTLKFDLRPTRAQIRRSHHPSIDVFPFPSVRTKFVELQNEIDEDEFCRDAMEGLRCWGGRAMLSRKGGEGVGSGTPWFLRKWECVVGDEEGELGRVSEWWRSMRGEE